MPARRTILAALAALLAMVAAVVLNGTPGTADPGPKPGFIRMFPDLPGLVSPTPQQLADLAQGMLDPNADAGDNPGITSGFTYVGQFLDHDLTLDTSAPPTGPVDPTTLDNARTFAFDLDSVYSDAPEAHTGDIFDAAGRFLLAPGERDYVRRADGSAVIYEGRNDENEIISQVQVAVMRAHNRLIDAGLSLANARQTLVDAYQAAIVGDFLPHLISASTDPKAVKALDPKKQGTLVEFSVAAYRFGHSQVRRAYVLNEASGKVQVFSATAPDLRGGRPLPAARVIDWSEFFSDLPNVDTDGNAINVSRRIDTLISSGLFVLPIPGAEATGSNVLAFRNMARGVFYALPSGQDIAASLGLPVLTPAQLGLGPAFAAGTPLWFYVLAESQLTEGGARLGPTGSTIVAAGFEAALKNGEKLVKGKVDAGQRAAIAGPDGVTTLSDLFVFAGVASR